MDHQLLDRFFRGVCSADEQHRVLSWYLSGKAEQELAEKIEAYWSAQQKLPNTEWGKESLFEQIQAEIKEGQVEQQSLLPTQKRLILKKNWYLSAAAILLLTVASAVFYFFMTVIPGDTHPEISELSTKQDSLIIKRTAKGEKLTVTLADSTVIRLNSDSQLQYLSSAPRKVFLQGEAFFEVKRDTLYPFLIHTANITTTVLGTSFNIRAFNEENIAVSVVSGEVKVEKEQHTTEEALRLLPGDQATYHIKDTLLSKGTFQYEDVLSWRDGRLYFKNARFEDIVQQLERWYGVEIVIKRSDLENGFSGSYTNRSLESVLEGMSFVLEFEYEIQDKQVIIR